MRTFESWKGSQKRSFKYGNLSALFPLFTHRIDPLISAAVIPFFKGLIVCLRGTLEMSLNFMVLLAFIRYFVT